ncbi:acyltransferase family protein [Patescibacteria group bacterium]|nr:acyltransferase family protein [Patescibacteria group bacterium]
MTTTKRRIDILDSIRGLAIIGIFMYHYYIEWFGGSFLVVPEGPGANFSRLWIFDGGGGVLGFMAAFVKNLLSWLFVYGFAQVNVFLVLSGFVLTYSLLAKGGLGQMKKVREWVSFYWKRLKRILIPFYISVVIGILFLLGKNLIFPVFAGAPLFDLWDVGKILIVPFTFFDMQLLQRFNGDYWFIPLILQLYLLFPLLFIALKKMGAARFMAFTLGLTILYRFCAAYYLDSVPMGVLYPAKESYRLFSFFLPRLFEFTFGMGLGYLSFMNEKFLDGLMKMRWFLLGFGATLLGFVCLTYRWGWIFSDSMLGFGLFFLLMGFAYVLGKIGFMQKFLQKAGESAYETYLLHHYFLNYFLFALLAVMGLKGNETVFWMVMPVYFAAVIFIGFAGKFLSVQVEKALSFRRKR